MFKVIEFESAECRRVRRLLDDFLSGELTIESNREIIDHLNICSECRRERDVRADLRSRLKADWALQEVPPHLRRSIELGLAGRRRTLWLRWAAALLLPLALAALYFAVPLIFREGEPVELVDHRPLAVADHLQCEGEIPAPEVRLPLQPVMSAIERIVQTDLAGYRFLKVAHCRSGETELFHYIFKGPSTVSLFVEPKKGRYAFDSRGSRSDRAGDAEFFVGRVMETDLAVLDSPAHFVYLVGEAEPVVRFAREIGPLLKSALSTAARGPLLVPAPPGAARTAATIRGVSLNTGESQAGKPSRQKRKSSPKPPARAAFL